VARHGNGGAVAMRAQVAAQAVKAEVEASCLERNLRTKIQALGWRREKKESPISRSHLYS
jgi:hypothetical protein